MLKSRNVSLFLIAAVFGLVVLLNSLATWHESDTPWDYFHNDHLNISSMYYARTIPDHSARDYFFNDQRYFTFYTPSFLLFVGLADSVIHDYFRSVALLQGPVLAGYLIAAYALFWQVSHSRAITITFALFSIIGINAIIDLWRVNGAYLMLPRTLALPGVVAATFLLLRFLNSHSDPRLMNGRAWWHWLLLGLLIGATTNLHPTTGIAFAITVGLTALAGWRRYHQPTISYLVILVIGVLVTSLPIIVNVVGGAGLRFERSPEDFRTFSAAFNQRVFMLPNPAHHLRAFSGEQQYLIGYLWLPLTLIPWMLIKTNRRSWTTLVFVAVQIAYSWLLINNIDKLVDVLMVVVAGAFFLWRWWSREEDQELVYYELIAAIVGVSFSMVFFLRTIWETFEIWSLTTIVAELLRGGRLLTIPFYLIGARLAFHTARATDRSEVRWLVAMAVLSVLVPLSPWHVVLLALLVFRDRLDEWRQRGLPYKAAYAGGITAVSVFMICQVVARQDPTSLALFVGLLVAAAYYGLSRLPLHERTIRAGIILSAAVILVVLTLLDVVSPTRFMNDSPWYVQTLRGTPDFITFLLGGVVGLSLWLIFKPYLPHRFTPPFYWVCTSLIVVMLVQSVGFFRYTLRPNTQEPPAIVQAGLWAKENTPVNALFYDTFDNGSNFRPWAQRSITNGWTELGLVGYSQPLELAPLTERYERILAHSQNAEDVLMMADELGADYIIRDRRSPLNLPLVYSNDELSIYQFTTPHQP